MGAHCSAGAEECAFIPLQFCALFKKRSPAFPTCAGGFGFTGVHYNRALTMRGLHGVSTVHESEPLMHQTISAVPCLWGFARK